MIRVEYLEDFQLRANLPIFYEGLCLSLVGELFTYLRAGPPLFVKARGRGYMAVVRGELAFVGVYFSRTEQS